MKGPFGQELMDEVKARSASLTVDWVCDCEDCRRAGVTQPSVLEYCGKRKSDGKAIGRWLHGGELKVLYQKKLELAEKMDSFTMLKMP